MTTELNEAFEGLAGQEGAALARTLEPGPLIRIIPTEERPRAACGLVLVRAPLDTLWETVGRPELMPGLIKMVDSVRYLDPAPDGREVVRVNLRFKITLFSTRFHFICTMERHPGHLVDLRYHAGKVRDVKIQLEALPVGDAASILRCHVGFDPMSLGWLVKFFLRHHPEIEWGLHAGSVMSITSSACEAAERKAGTR